MKACIMHHETRCSFASTKVLAPLSALQVMDYYTVPITGLTDITAEKNSALLEASPQCGVAAGPAHACWAGSTVNL